MNAKNRKEIIKELKEISPLLAEMQGKRSSLQVPEGYFRKLPDQLMGRIKESAKPILPPKPTAAWIERTLRQLEFLLQPRYALALSAIAVIMVATILFLPAEKNYSEENALADLTTEEARAYIASHIEDFELETVVEAAGELEDLLTFPSLDLSREEAEELLDELLYEMDMNTLDELL